MKVIFTSIFIFVLLLVAVKGKGSVFVSGGEISTTHNRRNENLLLKNKNAAPKPYKCDFENGICSFLINDDRNSVNWRIGKGKVKAGDTGPTIDHTLGTSNGSYIFVDVSKAKTGSVKLQTRTLTSDYCVRFFYHMYGADIGELTVSADSVYGSESVRYFNKTRTQGDRWKEARFSVSQTANMRYKGYRITFVAKGRSYSTVWGDIALDDMELVPGKCKDTKNDVYDLCSFNDYDCGYTSTPMGSLKWEWKSIPTTTKYFTKGANVDHTLGTSMGGYWFVEDEGYTIGKVTNVMLSSPVYNKPKTSLNCLHFYVYLDHASQSMFWGNVKENFVQVFINFPDSKDTRKWIVTKAKNATEHAVWTYVEAKAEITQKFQIQFIAGLQSPVEAVAALDDVKLIAGNCPEAGFCDFEQNKCSWVDGKGDYNWIRKTPSSRTNNETGPGIDNTLKTSSGNYMVFNTRYKKGGSTASLESEYFSPRKDGYCISFYYYMKGADLGTLRVNVKQENFTEVSIWILKGEQGDQWKQGKALLKPSLMYTRVEFQGITGNGNSSYMALDDVRIRKGETCDIIPVTADPRYEECYCENGHCKRESSGKIVCQCFPEYGLYSENKCKACDCGKNANCTFEIGTLFDDCLCPNGEKLKNTGCKETETQRTTDISTSTDWTESSNSETEPQHTTDISASTDWTESTKSETEPQHTTDYSTSTDWSESTYNSETEPLFFSVFTTSATGWSESTYSTAGQCECGKHAIACYLDNEGNKICLCKAGFSQLFDTCIDCYCGEKSRGCFFDENKEKKCLCNEGYAQNHDACKETCKYDRECLNGGICKMSYGKVGFCECRADYSGDRCEVNDVCKNFDDICQRYGAVCVIKDGLPSCECPSDRKDVTGLCENICNPTKCIHGRCEIFGQDFKCRCEVGFEGKHCDTEIAPRKIYGMPFFLFIICTVFLLILSIGVLCMTLYIRLKN